MPDYKKALTEGFEAAKKAEAARHEIAEVLEVFKSDVLAASDGKLLIEIRNFEEPLETNPFRQTILAARLLEPRPSYLALAARNPTVEGSDFKPLARWERSKDGYPCRLLLGKEEQNFHDRQALEQGLANLLRDPSVGEKLYSIINQVPK